MASAVEQSALGAEQPAPVDTPGDVVIIEPRRVGVAGRLTEVWRYRRLTHFFVDRAYDKMTTRTRLGRPWLIMRPLFEVLTMTFVFATVLKVKPGGGLPYFVFFLLGRSCWSLLDTGAVWATRSLEINRKLLRKVYVPRLLIPVASTAPAIVEFCFYMVLLALSFLVFGVLDGVLYLELGANLLLAPVPLLLAFSLALTLGIPLSVLNAEARDVRFTLQFVLGIWMFLTPIVYPLSLVPATYRPIAEINPMTSVIELWRYSLTGSADISTLSLLLCIGIIVIGGGFGLRYFAREEDRAVDRI